MKKEEWRNPFFKLLSSYFWDIKYNYYNFIWWRSRSSEY